MIAAWMAYCIGTGLALAIAGCATERALYLTGRPTRWAWSIALLGTLLLPLVAILRPQAFGTITVPLAVPAPRAASGASPGRTEDAVAPAPVSWRGLTWTDLDGVLWWGWGLSSVALLVVLGVAAARLQKAAVERVGVRRRFAGPGRRVVGERDPEQAPSRASNVCTWLVMPVGTIQVATARASSSAR
jgi:hypothetical protein